MKLFWKLALKIFLFSSIMYAIIILLFNTLSDNPFNLVQLLIRSAIFGIVMTAILVLIYRYNVRRKGLVINNYNDLNTKQNRRVITRLDKQNLVEKLREDPYFGNFKINEIKDGVRLKTGSSLISWGENIEILEKSEDNSAYTYEVTSKPYLGSTIIDFGKNLDNVNRLERFLTRG